MERNVERPVRYELTFPTALQDAATEQFLGFTDTISLAHELWFNFDMTLNSLRNSRKIQSFLLLALFAFMSWGLLAPGAFRFLRTNPFSPFALFNDVMLHFCVFAFVMLCFALVFSRGEAARIRTLALLLGAHGVITELAQAFIPTRTCDPLDLAANFIGIAVGCKLAMMYFGEQQPATNYAKRP